MEWEPENRDTDRWFPLVPWSGGTKFSPKGPICGVCANVHGLIRNVFNLYDMI